jgi:predicted glycogen debranching enzyme
MEPLIRTISREDLRDRRLLAGREWLVTNGMGGYASGTLAGTPTRRYHGYLIAALPSPLGRVVMFNHVAERLRFFAGETRNFESETTLFSGDLMSPDASAGQMGDFLTEFWLENGLPHWRYQVREFVIEKMVMMPHGQNSVFITYCLIEGPRDVQLEVRPGFHFRPHEADVSEEIGKPYSLSVTAGEFQIAGSDQLPVLRMTIEADRHYVVLDDSIRQAYYPGEAERGYDAIGSLWSPGFFCMILKPGQTASLIASAEEWRQVRAIRPAEAWDAEETRRSQLVAMAEESVQSGFGAELVLAADQFIITPVGRAEDAIRARASGDDVRTVIAGYHWFTDWGRDTMISLEGLTLATGRKMEARSILRTFGHYIHNGLIPNRFPEHETEAVYNTADATLWYFHAMDRYLDATGDRVTLRLLLPRFIEVMEFHLAGTVFGIGADPSDGLLRQGEEGYQLTWMDAKVGDWVVTPRRGKAVEINALWYNALSLLAQWLREESLPEPAGKYSDLADRVRESFNKRFWYAEGQYLYDCIDGPEGNDSALRPNQVFAISLPRAVLDRQYWEPVMNVVTERLLTPVGLRSLAPGHADYRPKYSGDIWARDASYHQGTVWAWLIGPYIDAWLKLHPDQKEGARRFLQGFEPHLSDACIGSINEVYDAEEPFSPRGCIAQAWSLAEVLRCWVKTSP